MAYVIHDNCVTCRVCETDCPTGAIYFRGEKYEIDPETCIECGICLNNCMLGAIENPNIPVEPVIPHAPKTIDCAVLVIGGGGSGLVAAVKAAEVSGEKVVLIEKTKHTGGGAWHSIDIKVLGSKMQQDAGVFDDMVDEVEQAMKTTRWLLEPQLVKTVLTASGRFFDWLCEKGDAEIHFGIGGTMYTERDGKGIKYINRNGDERKGAGRFIVEKMRAECDRLGVQILTQHAAQDVVLDENEKITAVLVKDPGGMTTINCKACILSAGSWICSEALTEQYTPKYAGVEKIRSAHRLPGNVGDGIVLGEKAGAYVDYDSFCVRLFGPFPTPFNRITTAFNSDNSSVYINSRGKRWVNECIHIFDTAPLLLEQPGGISYSVFDNAIITEIGQRNLAGMHSIDEALTETYQQDIAQLASYENTSVFMADTLEELADKMGVDSATFIAEIEKYNAFCEQGEDEAFLKNPRFLKPIQKAPFYSFRCNIMTDGAFGGILVNKNMSAYDQNKEPIEGLYATGDMASGRFVNHGGDKLQIINDLSFAVISGFIAGEHAGGYIIQ